MGVRVEEFYMGEERGLVRATCWRLLDAKDSCSCAPLCEGWVTLLGGGKGYGNDDVEVGDNVIVDTVFDRDCEPRRRG